MNRYAKRMRDHYVQHRSAELAAMTDPEGFFEGLGIQIESEIDVLADRIAARSDPPEGFVEKVGRLSEARLTAESEVLSAHMSAGLPQD